MSGWLAMLCGLMTVIIFIAAIVALKLRGPSARPAYRVLASLDRDAALSVILMTVTIGVLISMARTRARLRVQMIGQSQQQGEALLNENEAVIRACRAVAREFAGPLTGALVYSEMLVADATYVSEAQRLEVEGLREGVLRMERVLRCLREAVTDVGLGNERRVADDVEQAVEMPLAHQRFRGTNEPKSRKVIYDASFRNGDGWRNM